MAVVALAVLSLLLAGHDAVAAASAASPSALEKHNYDARSGLDGGHYSNVPPSKPVTADEAGFTYDTLVASASTVGVLRVVTDGATEDVGPVSATQTATDESAGAAEYTYDASRDVAWFANVEVGGLFAPVGQFVSAVSPATADSGHVYDHLADLVAPSSRLVPGGGLAAHELAGGHTLARHVGQSADDLAARLAAQPNIPAASTFSSRATAEASIASALDTNQAAIQAWLRGGGGNAGSAFTTSFADPVGTTLMRGASGPTSATSVRVVLRPDASMPGGFRILTAFPD